ncbi:MAG: PC4/YdbC family ssDNA-binding protein [Christensenella sp.]|nr:PC4/YdbC family ssDNA-binding protein [Christensenella sp.]
MAEFKFEIIKNYGKLSESTKGWRKEINLISWNAKEAKYDIREWSPESDKMGKGVTLSKEEISELKKILNQIEDI